MALDRIVAPVIKDAIDFNIQLKPYQKFSLDNGVEVYAYEGGSQEVLLVDMVFYAGNSFEQKNWVAAATNFLLKNCFFESACSLINLKKSALDCTKSWPFFTNGVSFPFL